ncbi:hypothetical protein ACFQFC_15465 [Amorphoplanes digitatis]|uniref:Uncharacterized protein n=1 Tax=Actinoplanes digitatis TaxID=1868 RepID=A0A7W7I3A3_9ACTN|nr:hypothetical protein [Actinoplanes digitatis]MBB4765611.1 hypothetical protein [Actinoplanes digitatis]
MSDDVRIPIGEALPGFALHPLEAGWTPLEAFVLIKCLDEDGGHSWSFRTTNPLNLEELLGALTVQVEVLRQKLVSQWDDEE